MYGTLYVVADLPAYQANPDQYLANNPLPIQDDLLKLSSRGREWKLDELVGDIDPLPMGRSFEVGKELFKVASCISCHKLGDQGQVFGTDLAKLDIKKHNLGMFLFLRNFGEKPAQWAPATLAEEFDPMRPS